MLKFVMVLCASILASGCIADPVKPKFMQPGAVESIVIGKTNATDVQALLGRPQEVRTVKDAEGESTIWRYQYVQRGTRELVPGLEEKLSRPAIRSILSVEYGPNNVVKKVERLNREIRTPEEGGILVPW